MDGVVVNLTTDPPSRVLRGFSQEEKPLCVGLTTGGVCCAQSERMSFERCWKTRKGELFITPQESCLWFVSCRLFRGSARSQSCSLCCVTQVCVTVLPESWMPFG